MSPSSGDPELGDGEAQVYRMRVSAALLFIVEESPIQPLLLLDFETIQFRAANALTRFHNDT